METSTLSSRCGPRIGIVRKRETGAAEVRALLGLISSRHRRRLCRSWSTHWILLIYARSAVIATVVLALCASARYVAETWLKLACTGLCSDEVPDAREVSFPVTKRKEFGSSVRHRY